MEYSVKFQVFLESKGTTTNTIFILFLTKRAVKVKKFTWNSKFEVERFSTPATKLSYPFPVRNEKDMLKKNKKKTTEYYYQKTLTTTTTTTYAIY